jgi:hypothetical protein
VTSRCGHEPWHHHRRNHQTNRQHRSRRWVGVRPLVEQTTRARSVNIAPTTPQHLETRSVLAGRSHRAAAACAWPKMSAGGRRRAGGEFVSRRCPPTMPTSSRPRMPTASTALHGVGSAPSCGAAARVGADARAARPRGTPPRSRGSGSEMRHARAVPGSGGCRRRTIVDAEAASAGD